MPHAEIKTIPKTIKITGKEFFEVVRLISSSSLRFFVEFSVLSPRTAIDGETALSFLLDVGDTEEAIVGFSVGVGDNIELFVGVGVELGDFVGVGFFVGVGTLVGVGIFVGVGVFVGTDVGVGVGVGVGTGVDELLVELFVGELNTTQSPTPSVCLP